MLESCRLAFFFGSLFLNSRLGYLGVSENRGPEYSTLNSRILIIGPRNKVPSFSESPISFV